MSTPEATSQTPSRGFDRQSDWKSSEIDQLASALSIAQGMLQPAVKDSTNPHFRSRYADLTSVWAACGEALQIGGLSVSQLVLPSERGFILRTVLLHKSGQWISSDLPMEPEMQNPQKVGSAITYARRYALASIVGVCPEDDDAETATGRGTGYGNGYQNGQSRPAPAPPPPPPAAKPAAKPAPPPDNRSCERYIADAAAKALCHAQAIYEEVCEEAIEAGYISGGLRDSDQVVDDVKVLYRNRKDWVREKVQASVKSRLKGGA